jgi:flagellar hook-basal body protein
LDDLNNPQESVPATAGGAPLEQLNTQWKNGIDLALYLGSANKDLPLKFDLKVDGAAAVTVDLSHLTSASRTFTGVEAAREITNAIAKAYGDEKYFNFSSLATPARNEKQVITPSVLKAALPYTLSVGTTNLTTSDLSNTPDPAELVDKIKAAVGYKEAPFEVSLGTGDDLNKLVITFKNPGASEDVAALKQGTALAQEGATIVSAGSLASPANLFQIAMIELDGNPTDFETITIDTEDLTDVGATLATLKPSDVAALIEEKLIEQMSDANIKVSYDPALMSFTFKTTPSKDFILKPAVGATNIFNLSPGGTRTNPLTGAYNADLIPRGDYIVPLASQRFGITATFDDSRQQFLISSGQTGDKSSVEISNATESAHSLFGFSKDDPDAFGKVSPSRTPLRGIESMPAVLSGKPIGINVNNKFRVDASNNQFVVTVNNVTGVVVMPQKADYTIEEFRNELEFRINSLSDSFGRTVNGVKVGIDKNALGQSFFKLTTGTTGNDAFLKVSANSIWGLADLESARGNTSRWVEPPQARNADGFPLFVNRDGLETSDPGGFSEDETAEKWSAIFLDKGELTFSTNGKLKSPGESIKFKASTIGETGATLQFAINYAGSTQFSSPFSVLAQSQNGRPEGDLIGLNIGDDGLVSANYSNGTQKNLAKIILANFTAPTGLRQLGDSSYLATSQSGKVTLGEAGAAGFGTVRAGATERANVDLTQELIELITAQRNFQANAKAIETNNTLTQAIINIRS